MPALKMTHLCVGLIVSAVGLALCLPSTANAGRVNKKQGPHYSQRAASNHEGPTGERTGIQQRLLGMLHQDGR
jgi:hypothetical protein